MTPKPKKVLIIGSGPIVIGQAAEFDYSGSQACRSLREEGVPTMLVNSHTAPLLTDAGIADSVHHGLQGNRTRAAATLDALSTGAAPPPELRSMRTPHPGAGIAHQVHGAIGFTYEHALHFVTRRLWSWRTEFGAESLWAERIGRRAASRGAAALWSDLTARGVFH